VTPGLSCAGGSLYVKSLLSGVSTVGGRYAAYQNTAGGPAAPAPVNTGGTATIKDCSVTAFEF
jgi:hypothetical protein